MPLIGSITLKIIIYSLWCYIAIQNLSQKDPKFRYSNKFKSALKFGVLRIIIGLIIGLVIWYLAFLIFPSDYSSRLKMNFSSALLTLFCIHLINWCIILRIMLGQILVKAKELFWILGGTFISCLMDIILFFCFQIVFGIC